jgi:hypothetical protein
MLTNSALETNGRSYKEFARPDHDPSNQELIGQRGLSSGGPDSYFPQEGVERLARIAGRAVRCVAACDGLGSRRGLDGRKRSAGRAPNERPQRPTAVSNLGRSIGV